MTFPTVVPIVNAVYRKVGLASPSEAGVTGIGVTRTRVTVDRVFGRLKVLLLHL